MKIVVTGDVLKAIPENAVLVGHVGETVLCHLVKNECTPFVVWTLGYNNGSVCWGHYFGSYDKALTYFKEVI